MPRLILSLALSLVPLSMNALSAQTCDPDGTVKFVCGTTNPEDLYQIPSTPWVIASGRYSDSEGPIYAVNARDHSTREIFPAGALPPQHDRDTYRACPGPNTVFQPHGLTLREGSGSVHTLYVVGHGAREAIEVFELDAGGALPTMKWIGCIPAPEGVRRINSITALPGGYLGATNFDPTGGEHYGQPLSGEILFEGEYRPVELTTEPDGALKGFSPALGLYLCPNEDRLIFFDPATGSYLLNLSQERDARRQAESALHDERAEREAAQTRIRQLEEELRRRQSED